MELEQGGAPTSAQGSQVLLGVVVQLLHAGRSGGGEEDVSLLMPRCSVVDTQFALCIKVGDSCRTKNRAQHKTSSLSSINLAEKERFLLGTALSRTGTGLLQHLYSHQIAADTIFSVFPHHVIPVSL